MKTSVDKSGQSGGRKILLMGTGDGTIGGTEQIVCRLSRNLSARGHFVETIFPETPKSPALLTWSRSHGVMAETTPALRCVAEPHGWNDVLALRGFLRQSRPDIVNLHYGNNFISLKDVLAVRLAGVRRCYVTIHQAAPWESIGAHKQKMTAQAARLCDQVVAICDATRALMLEAGIAPGKVPVLYCGFGEPSVLPGRSEARRRLGLEEGAFIIVTMASLVPRKGIADLIEAAARVPDPRGDLRLVIGGDGPERAALEAQAASTLGPRAVFLGQILGSTADVYAAADLFVLPSYQEGLPGVYFEAAFHGIPSVGTHVGGSPEAVLDEKTGLLVPPGDPAALATAIGRLRDDPDLRRRLGEAARVRSLAMFTDAAMTDRYEALFFEKGRSR